MLQRCRRVDRVTAAQWRGRDEVDRTRQDRVVEGVQDAQISGGPGLSQRTVAITAAHAVVKQFLDQLDTCVQHDVPGCCLLDDTS